MSIRKEEAVTKWAQVLDEDQENNIDEGEYSPYKKLPILLIKNLQL